MPLDAPFSTTPMSSDRRTVIHPENESKRETLAVCPNLPHSPKWPPRPSFPIPPPPLPFIYVVLSFFFSLSLPFVSNIADKKKEYTPPPLSNNKNINTTKCVRRS